MTPLSLVARGTRDINISETSRQNHTKQQRKHCASKRLQNKNGDLELYGVFNHFHCDFRGIMKEWHIPVIWHIDSEHWFLLKYFLSVVERRAAKF